MEFKNVNCNLCGSGKTRFLGKRISPDRDRRLETRIVKCASCGLVYPNPMPQFTAEELNGNFNQPVGYFDTAAEDRLGSFEEILSEIEKMRPEKGRIIDVGCGRGEFLHIARKHKWDCVGTDVSKAFVQYAKENFKVNAFVGDISDLDLHKDSFDAACLISVLQYVQDPMKTLKRITDLLKKDGVLYIEATNENALIFKMADLVKSIKERGRVTTHLSPLFPSYQVYGFDKKAILTALKKLGFRIHYIRVGGVKGGGKIGGEGAWNFLVNLARKIIIFIGGVTGNGHLIFCVAKKEDKK